MPVENGLLVKYEREWFIRTEEDELIDLTEYMANIIEVIPNETVIIFNYNEKTDEKITITFAEYLTPPVKNNTRIINVLIDSPVTFSLRYLD